MSMREVPRKAAATRQDPRFAAVGTDPRFQRFPKKQKRLEIDERFAGESAVCMHASKADTPYTTPSYSVVRISVLHPVLRSCVDYRRTQACSLIPAFSSPLEWINAAER